MRVAVSNIAWEADDTPAVVDRLLAAGVSGVEIAPTKIWPDLTRVVPDQAATYGRTWADVGLPVVAAQSLLFGRPDLELFGDSRPELVRYLGHVIEICAAMGATALVFGSPGNRRRGSLAADVADKIAADAFGELASRAVAAGACLCLEPNPEQYGADFLTRVADAAALVATVDSAGLRLHLDTACMALAGDDGPASVAAYAPLLRHVHVSEPFLGPVGTPAGQHDDLARALRDVRYEHWVSVEMRPVETGAVAAVDAAARYAVAVYGDRP